MPWKVKTPCGYPGCAALTSGRYCPEHAASAKTAAAEQKRLSPGRSLYCTREWARLRVEQLRREPFCQCPACAGRRVPAQVVDRKKPHRGDPTLFFDRANLRSMSKPCHDSKTAAEDGGFGNRVAHIP